MGRADLAHAQRDAANAVLAAAGYNLRRLLAWLRDLSRVCIAGFFATTSRSPSRTAFA